MTSITIEVPGDPFAASRRSPHELGREMRLAAAMLWYAQGRISHEKAAEFAGISRIALIDALAAARLPAFPVDVDELMEEVERARLPDRERLAPGLPGAGGPAGAAPGGGI